SEQMMYTGIGRQTHVTKRQLDSQKEIVDFFFSSRRRHTRLQGDWSSDVCSSDLRLKPERIRNSAGGTFPRSKRRTSGASRRRPRIGRASCRERVEISVGAGAVEKEKEKEITEMALDSEKEIADVEYEDV